MNVWIVAVCAAALVEAASTSSPLSVAPRPANQVRVVRYGDDRLKGISQVDVLLMVTGDISRCPVERGRLQQAAVAALRAERIRATVSEKASSWFYSVLVTIHSAAVGGSCASAVNSELIAQVDGIPEADRHLAAGAWGSLLVGPLSLIRETAMVTSPASSHAVRLLAALGPQMTSIGGRIAAANR